MSLILEALRKSEAERRRAQAPDLFAPAQVAVAPARRVPRAWLVAAAALALLVLAWVAARALWPASGDLPATAAGGTQEIEPPRGGPDPASIATPARPASRSTVSAAATAAPASPVAPRLLPASPAGMAPASRDQTSAVPGSTPPAEAPPIPAGMAQQRGEARPTEPAAPLPALPPPASPRPASPPPASPPAASPAPVVASDPAAPPMRLSELAGDARRQLPPLKLTMHMWNQAADRRFVILDGRRLVEGDRIGAARVAEIRRDGVILDWNGQRLELPLH